jgi:CubicO group peptidase (beta-lactamase class C family)
MVCDRRADPRVWTPTAYRLHAIVRLSVGEIARSSRSVGAFFRDEIAKPLGISELHIGAPASAEPKISTLTSRIDMNPSDPELQERMRQVMGPGSLAGRALGMNLPGNLNDLLNSPAGRQAEIPAVNGVMSARGLARMYACLAGYGEIDGTRIISEGTVRKMSTQQTHRPDAVIILPIGWALGYMTGGDPGWPQGPRLTSFGHATSSAPAAPPRSPTPPAPARRRWRNVVSSSARARSPAPAAMA